MPNILIVISDQHRWGLTKRSGYPLDTSPELDRLADRGVVFNRAYATQPVCAPCRTSLLTGRWPQAHRVRQNPAVNDAFSNGDVFSAARARGYKTGLAGKNHTYLKPDRLDFWREYNDLIGWQPENPPQDIVNFDNWRRKLNFAVSHVPTPFPLETQFSYRAVSSAIEFLDRFGDQSFMLEVSFPEPHDPEQVPKPYWDMFPPDSIPDRGVGPEALKDKGFRWQWMRRLQDHYYPDYDRNWRRYVSNYLGSLRMVDDQFGRLLAYMRRRNLLDNTVIVYTADHGDFVMDYGLMRKGIGLSEDLVHIPMVWAGAGIRARASHPAFVSMADVMPTLCETMGADIPHGVQGRSLWPLLIGGEYPDEEFRSIYAEGGYGGLYYDAADRPPFRIAEFRGAGPYTVPEKNATFDELNAVTQSGNMKMLRMGDWKLIFDMMGYGELYNLASDPYELNNRFADPAAAADRSRLLEELLMWTIRTQDSLTSPSVAHGYQTKWPKGHNWYTPYRHGTAPKAFVP